MYGLRVSPRGRPLGGCDLRNVGFRGAQRRYVMRGSPRSLAVSWGISAVTQGISTSSVYFQGISAAT
eukprot:8790646-Pyramimonas_sp.AAC.1